MWKALLLIYKELDVGLATSSLRKRRFHHYLSPEAVDDAVESFRGFPELVRELTSGAATVEYQMKTNSGHRLTIRESSSTSARPSPGMIRFLSFGPSTILKTKRRYPVAHGV